MLDINGRIDKSDVMYWHEDAVLYRLMLAVKRYDGEPMTALDMAREFKRQVDGMTAEDLARVIVDGRRAADEADEDDESEGE